MTVQKSYRPLGGGFAKAEALLPSVGLITKCITKFLDDSSFSELYRVLKNGRRKEAFRAAHTRKGVCANLGFDRPGARIVS